MGMGGYGIWHCDRICLHIWQSAIIHPSIHLSAHQHHSPHFLTVGRTPYGLLVVGVGENERTRIPVFPYSPYSPYSPPSASRSLPVSRFPSALLYFLHVSAAPSFVLPYPVPAYPLDRLLRAGARVGAQSRSGASLVAASAARIAPISFPDCSLTTHAGLLQCLLPYHDCKAPVATTALRPPACQYQLHCFSLAAGCFQSLFSSSYLCRIIIVHSSLYFAPRHIRHTHPQRSTSLVRTAPIGSYALHPQLLSFSVAVEPSPAVDLRPAHSQALLSPFQIIFGGWVLTREYTSRDLLQVSFSVHVAIVPNRVR